ncbi:hypothetical protein QBC34DRAFT_417218 [Podospora aff. communis PSN243]|uniref:Uncharacterized protein n=1 Tax=Podospora aff. communis PSN243 TaxID=3040156 RepID=A0AAV9G7L4_9PEZI|nr:hypothetical protein QBC34DRAFT_417218 [Podospora aff. communis PSN243]
MLGLEFSRERSTLTHIQAVQRTVYTLPNPTDAFEAICAEDEEARRFLEKCYSRGLSVYMVVGIHTFHDARVEKQGVVGEKVVQQVTVPVVGIAAAAAGGVPLVGLGDVLDVGVEVEGGRDEVEATAFFAPGEQVFGIEYRKVSYDWFVIGGDVASSARLKKKSAWECCWMRSGPPQPGEEAYAVEVDVSLEPDKDDIGAGCELVVMAGGQGVEQVFVFNS